jgi:hypothetical protein
MATMALLTNFSDSKTIVKKKKIKATIKNKCAQVLVAHIW